MSNRLLHFYPATFLLGLDCHFQRDPYTQSTFEGFYSTSDYNRISSVLTFIHFLLQFIFIL
jgi:hypothetical protein